MCVCVCVCVRASCVCVCVYYSCTIPLQELYVAFNHISDISMVTMLSALELLDVEG